MHEERFIKSPVVVVSSLLLFAHSASSLLLPLNLLILHSLNNLLWLRTQQVIIPPDTVGSHSNIVAIMKEKLDNIHVGYEILV